MRARVCVCVCVCVLVCVSAGIAPGVLVLCIHHLTDTMLHVTTADVPPPPPTPTRVMQAVDYLKQVMRYREMGYQEKGIHEAYQKSSKDWDKTLDILLQQQ